MVKRPEHEEKAADLPANLHSHHIYGDKFWVVSERMRSQIKVVETSFWTLS